METCSEWARKAYNYTFLAREPFSIVGCWKNVEGPETTESVAWGVGSYSSRQNLDLACQAFKASKCYHFFAAFDQTSPEWEENRPIYSSEIREVGPPPLR